MAIKNIRIYQKMKTKSQLGIEKYIKKCEKTKGCYKPRFTDIFQYFKQI